MEKILLTLFIVISILISCKKIIPQLPSDDEVLEGPLEGLSYEESQQFLRGDAVVGEVFTKETGLGSTFVATSCVSCHSGDGKGHPSNALTRFGQPDEFGNLFLDQGGPQLQNRALPGYLPEQIPAGATFTKLVPPSIVGLGYLDFVTDADIMAMSDPTDLDGDGISGEPNWMVIPTYLTQKQGAIVQNGKNICRFGKKAGAYDLMDQIVKAFNQDIGITTTYDPVDAYSHQEIDPEISNQKVLDLVGYIRMLKAPTPRNQEDAEVIKGKNIFTQLNCIGCHKATLQTGYSPIKSLSYKEFHPYTDLLLHDMGPDLDDQYTEGSAKTSEWRTPPLWGLGLAKSSQGGKYYLLHDGRAKTFESAILYHGGEASGAKALFLMLTSSDKEALYKFLESL